MTHHLRPCSVCSRHVRAEATRCPFCDQALDLAPPLPAVPSPRIGRAARMAFGALSACAASNLAGCSSGTGPVGDAGGGETSAVADGSSHADAGTDSGVDTGTPQPFDSGNIAKPYGAPPADGMTRVV